MPHRRVIGFHKYIFNVDILGDVLSMYNIFHDQIHFGQYCISDIDLFGLFRDQELVHLNVIIVNALSCLKLCDVIIV